MSLAPMRRTAAPCSCTFRSSSRVPRVTLRGRPQGLFVKAQEGEQPPAQEAGASNREDLLEALEAQARGKKGAKALQAEAVRPMRSQAGQQKKVVWKEGQLLPEGWDEMDLGTKMTQLYMGERGFMFWANKAALASIFIIVGAWIVFRFVGPALGLYTLSSDIQQFNY